MKKIIMCLIITMTITSTVKAAEVPRESAPCNASNEAIFFVVGFIDDILTEVQNGLGYADARAKSNRIFFNAWINGQTNGYTDLKELRPTIVNTLIKRIDVHNPDEKFKHRRVKIDIYFTAVGLISIPDEKELLTLMDEIRNEKSA